MWMEEGREGGWSIYLWMERLEFLAEKKGEGGGEGL